MNAGQEIGLRIKEFAKNKFQGITELSINLGIKQSNLSRYVSGKSKPGAEILAKLASLGADINYILTGESLMDEKLLLDLMRETKELKAQNQELKAFLFDFSRRFDSLQKDFELLNTEIDTLKKEKENLAEDNKTLKKSAKADKSKLKDYEAEVKRLSVQNIELNKVAERVAKYGINNRAKRRGGN